MPFFTPHQQQPHCETLISFSVTQLSSKGVKKDPNRGTLAEENTT